MSPGKGRDNLQGAEKHLSFLSQHTSSPGKPPWSHPYREDGQMEKTTVTFKSGSLFAEGLGKIPSLEALAGFGFKYVPGTRGEWVRA